jgi:AcrR family transcriptional regulator
VSARREQRRAEIVAEARALVLEQGLHALTIGALEKRLTYTRGVITYHFVDKDDLVDAVLGSAVAEIDAATASAVRAGQGVRERIEAALRATVRGFVEHPEAAAVLIGFWGRLRTDPRAAEINAALYRRYRRDLAGLLRRGVELDELGPRDADALAAVGVAAVIGLIGQALFEPGAVDVDRATAALAAALTASAVPGPGQDHAAGV